MVNNLMGLFGLAAVYLLVAVQLMLPANATNDAATTSRWQRLQLSCINEQNSLQRAIAESNLECLASALTVNGDIVAEWNSDTGVCSVYAFCAVSHLATASTNAASTVCAVYRKVSKIFDFVQSLSQKFVAAWLFDADANTNNVLCNSNSNKNRFHPVNIEWNADGATFNGVDSYMLLNDSEYMNFDNGLTWLLRLKRQPRMQGILISADCDNLNTNAACLLEFDAASKLYYNTRNKMSLLPFGSTKAGEMPSDENAWTNIGVSVSAARIDFFVDGRFLPDPQVQQYSQSGDPRPKYCFKLGHKLVTDDFLNGTVRAVGIANASLTEQESQKFFELLPSD